MAVQPFSCDVVNPIIRHPINQPSGGHSTSKSWGSSTIDCLTRLSLLSWLVVLTILKNMSSSMGRMTSHILRKIKNVPNHRPVIPYFSHYYQDYLKKSHLSLGLSQIIPCLSHIRSSYSNYLGFTAAKKNTLW